MWMVPASLMRAVLLEGHSIVARKSKGVFVNLDEDAVINEPIEDERAAERDRISRDIAVRISVRMLATALGETFNELTERAGLTLVILPSLEWSGPVRDAIRGGSGNSDSAIGGFSA